MIGTILDPAIVGLSVAYVFSLTDTFSFSVRVSTEIENYVSREKKRPVACKVVVCLLLDGICRAFVSIREIGIGRGT